MHKDDKWQLNPKATLGELARSEEDEGYQKTICGVLRTLWLKINVDLNGHIPEGHFEEVNHLLEKAFLMGKRMDQRLHDYFRLVNSGMSAASKDFTGEVVTDVSLTKPKKDKK